MMLHDSLVQHLRSAIDKLRQAQSHDQDSPAAQVAEQVIAELHQALDLQQQLRAMRDELEARVQRRTTQLAQANDALLEEIAERRATEQQLMALNATLEQRVAERTAAATSRAQELDREKQFSELLIRSSMDGILAFDSECRYTVWNPAMERMTGMSAAQVLGKVAFDVFPFLRKTREDRAFVATLAGTWLQRTDRPYRVPETGREGYYEAHYSTLREESGNIVGGLAVIRDITERKESDRRLLQAERLSAVGQMIAGMAHESRNALQRSQACLDVLSLKVADRPEVHDLIGRIQSAQDHLHHLYEEVRNYAAPIRLKQDYADVREILHTAWEQLAGVRQGRTAELVESGDCDCVSQVDSQMMQKVFYNVLENSLSASPDPVKITAQWSTESTDGAPFLNLVLNDNGPGLTPEQQSRIFEPFYTTKTRGTGLGMPIARRLVEAHGGRMTAGIGPSEGAEVRITLPRR